MNPNPPRQPIFNVPAPLLAILAVLIAIHAVRQGVSNMTNADLLARFAFVPGRFTLAWDAAKVIGPLAGLNSPDPAIAQRAEVARFFLGGGAPQPWTVLTYAFLHGDWVHLGLNGVWLLAFGAPVARRFGAVRFFLFMAAAALAGAAAHYLVYPYDLQPVIGASAAVSGCMGAALRFVFQPQRSVAQTAENPARAGRPDSIVPIPAVLRDRRCLTFLVVWFATNLVTGVGAVPLGLSNAPIAWQAHIGGFLLGFLGIGLFDRPRRAAAQPESPPGPEDAAGT